ncbi:uncharacterized protein LOC113374441 [Ctenocephalides felis]|uniref:uncharacterized protein LOC113374441 n=1 Tax=Ctenocephalides felis TaxID=7515 RepID=UPI000E6E388C|nr:uncharacterized protein LOC113374441 [Ctenocephalides felis]
MVDGKAKLIENIFPNLKHNHEDHEWLQERAILAATNLDVDEINLKILQILPGYEFTFKSVDIVIDPDEIVNYPVEFLNSLNLPGMPLHKLLLKVGSPIILLSNLNAPKLCNGTRLAIKIMGNITEAIILGGKFKDDVVLLPRIPLIPSESVILFKRLQFLIRLAYAMTINKSQEQTMNFCGINLVNPCFNHGQLYIACSRDRNRNNSYIYTPNNLTKNIVYPLALH